MAKPMKPRTPGATRAVAYLRVSTPDQVKHEISLPSQQAAIEGWCLRHGVELVRTVVDEGLSGRDGARPAFRRLLADAAKPDRTFDAVVIYSLARFARNLKDQLNAIEQIEAAGVELVSVTEPLSAGASGRLLRNMIGAFNEHLSSECSKNTIRTMNANAKVGYYNGGPVPYGYVAATVGYYGNKAKKKLALHPEEAPLVGMIFDMAEVGRGEGPMGARKIAACLRELGHTFRGGKFSNSNVAMILARQHYVGFYYDARTTDLGEPLPEAEWTKVPCPALVSEQQFDAVAATRAKRNPRVTPPRVVTGVTMLPGNIARCGQPACENGLTVRTGKGGQYHYYVCNHRATAGAKACNLKSIRREALDGVVLDALFKRILEPGHLVPLLRGLLDRSEDSDARRRKALGVAKAALTESEKALTNLYMIREREAGAFDDPVLAQRTAHHRDRIATLKVEIDTAERQLSRSSRRITPAMVEAFGPYLRDRIRNGSPDFQRAYVSLLVDRVIVSNDAIRIMGSPGALEHAIVSDGGDGTGTVPIFDRKWCGREDSNFHGLSATTTSTLRVYQFRHDRTSGSPAGAELW